MKNYFTKVSQFIDLKAGLLIAFFMGSVVFCINYFSTYLLTLSLIAAAKQWIYTFLLGGTVLKASEHIVKRIQPKVKAVILATVIPSVISLLLVYGLHNLRGTPKPLESTLPTLLVFPGALFWALKKRKETEKE